MIGRDYFSRQAATLLKIARITSNPTTVIAAAIKAADLKAKLDEAPVEVPTPQPNEIKKQ
jgi:hypothetical protein